MQLAPFRLSFTLAMNSVQSIFVKSCWNSGFWCLFNYKLAFSVLCMCLLYIEMCFANTTGTFQALLLLWPGIVCNPVLWNVAGILAYSLFHYKLAFSVLCMCILYMEFSVFYHFTNTAGTIQALWNVAAFLAFDLCLYTSLTSVN